MYTDNNLFLFFFWHTQPLVPTFLQEIFSNRQLNRNESKSSPTTHAANVYIATWCTLVYTATWLYNEMKFMKRLCPHGMFIVFTSLEKQRMQAMADRFINATMLEIKGT